MENEGISQSQALSQELNPKSAADEASTSLAQEASALGPDEEAENAFLRVLETAPEFAAARNGLALLYQKRGEWSRALAQFECAAQSDPGNPAIRNSIAAMLRHLGRWAEAEANYRQTLQIDGRFAPARQGLGLMHRHRGAHAEALAEFESAAALAPHDPWPRLEAAEELNALGRSGEQLTALRSAVAEFPEFAPGFDRLAGALRRERRLDDALAAVEAALALEPGNLWLRCARAETFHDLGRPEDAVAEFEATLRLRENFAPALSGLGRLAQARGDRAQALAAFAAAAAAEPENPWLVTAMGEELATAGRYQEAEAALAAALRSRADFAPALNARGLLERRRGDASAAAASFAAAVAADPINLWYRASAASALHAAGRSGEAEAAYLQILARDAAFAGAHHGLGEIYRQRGDLARAETAFAAAARNEPENVWRRLSLAEARVAQGKWEVARADYGAILLRHPDFPAALQGLARVRTHLEDHEGALDALRNAVAAEPNDPWLRNAVVFNFRALRRYEEAERAARENVARHPDSAVAWLEFAHCLRRDASPDAVLQALRQALALEPDDANLKCALAAECLRQWRLSEADALYRSVIEHAPACLDAWAGRGVIARRRGEPALAFFETAVRLDPSLPALSELAQEHALRGDFHAARGVLQTALEAHDDDAGLLMQWGYLERSAADRRAAAVAFGRAREKHPRLVPAYVEAHREALALGRMGEALELLGAALRLEPNAAGALEALAQLLQSADREADALAVLQRWIEDDPTAISGRLAVARIEARLGRLDRAMTIIDGLLIYIGPQPDLFVTKAALLRDAGLHEEAARTLVDGGALLSDLPVFLYERAALAIHCGDLSLAARLMDRLGDGKPWLVAQAAAAAWDFAGVVAHLRETLAAPAEAHRLAFATKAALAAFDIDAAEASLRTEAAANRSSAELRGQPTHPLQSHGGHLLSEWRLDGDAFAGARRALANLDDPVDPLLAVVRDFPDYTPAAVALMIALRNGKRLTTLSEGRRVRAERRIPRRIAQFWDQNTLPPDLARLAETWRDNNPGYAYQRFSEFSAFDWLRMRQLPEAARAFARAREPAQKADLFRLAWLAQEGGYWVDIDDRCVAPIAMIDPGGRSLLAYQEDFGSAGNDFLGAAPQHPLIVAALEAAVHAINRGDGDILWLSTGPGLLTRIFAAAAAADLDAFLGPDGPLILERRELFTAVRIHCSAAYKHSPKHWGGAFNRRKTQKIAPMLDALLALAGLRSGVEPQTTRAS